MLGLRVMRGPDWRGGDTDGGEGYVGTLIQLLGNHTVRVLWDMGQESTCSAGADGKLELRVFDTAQSGIRHTNTRCAGCGEIDIFGMLWRCQDCAGCDLCPLCYSDDKHDIRHRFLRIDKPETDGQPVPKRKTSVKIRAIGMFPGSKVTRGKDWRWGDQDGGQGSEGEVIGYQNVSTDSSRNLVRVQWSEMGAPNTYRLGFHGYVDLRCVEEEVGPFYYRDHLPLLDTEQVAKLSKADNPDTTGQNSSQTASDFSNSTETASTSPLRPSVTSTHAPDSEAERVQLNANLTKGRTSTADFPTVKSADLPPAKSADLLPVNSAPVKSGNLPTVKSADLPPVKSADLPTVKSADLPSVKSADLPTVKSADLPTVKSADITPVKSADITPVKSADITPVKSEELDGCHAAADGDAAHRAGSLPDGSHDAREITRTAEGVFLTPGVGVAVRVGAQQLLELQGRCGGTLIKDTKTILGHTGEVTGRGGSGGVTVKFKSCEVTLNPEALVTVKEFQKGDKVRIRDDSAEVKILNCRVGWKDDMEETTGKVGQVVNVDRDGDLLVSFGRHHFLFSPACCTHVTSDTHVDALKLEANRAVGSAPKTVGSVGKATDDPKAFFRLLRDAVKRDNSESSLSSLSANPGILFAAIRQGDHITVRRMCAGNKWMVEYELERLTPLMTACAHGHQQVVHVLLELGADVNHYTQPMRSPLGAATEGKNEDIIVLLLESGANPLYLDKKLHTYVHLAAYHNLPRAIKALAAHGVDINAQDAFGDTALHLAIVKHRHEAVETLLSVEGVDITVPNGNGFPLVPHACTKGDARALELILKKDKSQANVLCHGNSPLHLAANDDYDECVRVLVLCGGADVNIKDTIGASYTPLHLACIRAMFRASEALLELGADVHSQDSNGHTPLHLAIGGRRNKDPHEPGWEQENQLRVALACMLISNGAYVDAPDFGGRSPLTYGVPAVKEGVHKFMKHNTGLVKRKGGVQSLENLSLQGQGNAQLKDALKGVGLPCGVCGAAKSDVTLQPCQHKCVCSSCSVKVTVCPLCDEEVKDKLFTGADEQSFDAAACKQM